MGYRNLPEPQFNSTRADRILVVFCVLVIAALLAYAILNGAGVL